MRQRAFLAAVASGLFLVFQVHALEWDLESVSTLQTNNAPSPPSVGIEELFGSLKIPFGSAGSRLEAKAHVLGELVPTAGGADFDVLALTWALPKPGSDFQVLTGTVGRFTLAEATGLILNHPGDGLKFVANYKGFDLALAGAYTGYVNRSSASGISMTLQDEANASGWFDSPRLVASLEAGFTPFWSQRFTFSALAQHDMNSSSGLLSTGTSVYSTTMGGTLDTQYFTLKAQGPVVDRLLYELFGTLGTGSTLSWISGSYQYQPIVSFLTGGTLSYFAEGPLEPVVRARVLVASGDPSATSAVEGNVRTIETLFLPMTSTTLGVVFSPALSNLIDYEIGGSLKPVAGFGLVTGVKLLGFQRATAGVVNASGVLSGGPVWMGEEADLTADWPLFSDLSASASAGAFLPTSGTYSSGATGDGFQWGLDLAVDLKF